MRAAIRRLKLRAMRHLVAVRLLLWPGNHRPFGQEGAPRRPLSLLVSLAGSGRAAGGVVLLPYATKLGEVT